MMERSRPALFLRTFGAPDLLAGTAPLKLRAKDLALLTYLRLHEPGAHRRSVLASLLWAENSEQGARHSLTQAVGRLRKVLGAAAIDTTRDTVVWAGTLACDAALLEEAARIDRPSLLEFCEGEFMAGMALGAGTQAFDQWAAARRVEYRDLAADLMERWGAAAEREGDWPAALRFSQRETEIDPYHEPGHRRVMRALDALGERNRALLHYAQYAAFVRREMDLAPQSETTALADALRAGDSAASAPTPAQPVPIADAPAASAAESPAPAAAEPHAACAEEPHAASVEPDAAAGEAAAATMPPPHGCATAERGCPRCYTPAEAHHAAAAARWGLLTAGMVAAAIALTLLLGRAGVRSS